MDNTKPRLEFADIIKALGIILVVIGHTSSDLKEIFPYKSFVYAFSMPLFFIISGMFISTTRTEYSLQTLGNFLKKNCIALLIPFFLWGLIYMNFSYTNILHLCYGSYISLIHIKTLTSLWFILVLFAARVYLELLFMTINKLKLNTQYTMYLMIPVFFALGLLLPHHNNAQTQIGNFLNYDVAFIASGFMLIGSLIKPLTIKMLNTKNIYLILLTIISTGLFVYGYSLTDFRHEFVLMANADYKNPILFLINSLTGSLSVILIGILICKIPVKKRVLNFLGRNTLGIYLTHKHIAVALLNYLQTNTDLSRLSINTIITIVAITISSLIVLLINNVAPILFGKTKSTQSK